jgi:ABC-type dipeptide/oligopeptide/nickel transport system ATPase component
MTAKFLKRPASRKQTKARIALVGPAGSGKTFTALAIAAVLGERPAVIDTEGGSSEKYDDRFDFEIIRLEDFAPLNYVDAIKFCELDGNDVVIIDSLSHAWAGTGGALQRVDQAAKKYGGNRWSGWSDVTPEINSLVDTILMSRAHIIACMRSKTEWALEQVNGKQKPTKIGLAPVQREGVDYEFDIFGELDLEHNMTVTKTRMTDLDGKMFHKPGTEFANLVLKWLNSGEKNPYQEERSKEKLIEIARLRLDMTPQDISTVLANAGMKYDPEKWDEMLEVLEKARNGK